MYSKKTIFNCLIQLCRQFHRDLYNLKQLEVSDERYTCFFFQRERNLKINIKKHLLPKCLEIYWTSWQSPTFIRCLVKWEYNAAYHSALFPLSVVILIFYRTLRALQSRAYLGLSFVTILPLVTKYGVQSNEWKVSNLVLCLVYTIVPLLSGLYCRLNKL